MKTVIVSCEGRFALSKQAIDFMIKRGNKLAIKELMIVKELLIKNIKPFNINVLTKCLNAFPYQNIFVLTKHRSDPDLILAIKTLGFKAFYGGRTEKSKLNRLIDIKFDDSEIYCKIKYNPYRSGETIDFVNKKIK
jgi:hypothetical protein